MPYNGKIDRSRIIGLTGLPGSGKSFFARCLGYLGVSIIDVDRIGRRVVEENEETLRLLQDTFGQDIIGEDKKLDRRLLGQRAFLSEEGRNALNRIVWPAMLKEVAFEIERLRSKTSLIVLDMAILFESGSEVLCDHTVVITAPECKRIERLMKRDGWTPEEAAARNSSQWSEQEKCRLADTIIENDTTLEALQTKAEEWLEYYTKMTSD
jgi:dephospho-CoA kinase